MYQRLKTAVFLCLLTICGQGVAIDAGYDRLPDYRELKRGYNPLVADYKISGSPHTCTPDRIGLTCGDDDSYMWSNPLTLMLARDGDGSKDQGSLDGLPLNLTERFVTDLGGAVSNTDTDDGGVSEGSGVFVFDDKETREKGNDRLRDNDHAFDNDAGAITDQNNDGVRDNHDALASDDHHLDANNDGVPNVPEIAYGLNPDDASDASSVQNKDGANALKEFSDFTKLQGSIDIDGNGEFDALTDGLLLLRGMFGLTGDALTSGAVGLGAIYSSSAEIEDRINTLGPLADIDGNGRVGPLTDGLLIVRYLFGLRGAALINGVLATDSALTGASEIEKNIRLVMPSTGVQAAPSSASGWMEGSYDPRQNFASSCADPRAGGSYSDRQGSVVDENFWIRSYSDDTYLWYRELKDVDPGSVNSTAAYFDLMKTDAVTPSGNFKDQFHFTYDTEYWNQISQSGITAGYGWQLVLVRSAPPRKIVIADVEPNTPASTNDIARGTELISVDGVAVLDGSAAGLNAGLFSLDVGEEHSFVIRDLGATTTRTIVMKSLEVVSQPVKNVKSLDLNGTKVGYMTFNSHIATAEQQLIDAVNQLKRAKISELVIDLRYNGGGYLDIAGQLASMVAGDIASGQIFEEMTFNDKYPGIDPITGRNLSPTYFPSISSGFATNSRVVLPKLNLSRVFVLSTGGTASASEAFINGLRGIDVQVVLIGDNTRGKPYGFYGIDNCGTTYFTIQFKGSNAKGFGEYSDGFIPSSVDNMYGSEVLGCRAADDLNHLLGDRNERLFGAALQFIQTGRCPENSVAADRLPQKTRQPYASGDLLAPELPGRVMQ